MPTVRHLAKRMRSYWVQDASFITLMVMLGFTIFAVPTFIEHVFARAETLHLSVLAIFFVGMWSAYKPFLKIIGMILFISSLSLYFTCYFYNNEDLRAFLWITYSLNTLVFIITNLQLLFRDDQFNFYRVLGAVNVYLLIALLGAFLFELVYYTFGSSLKGDVVLVSADEDFADYLYFSLVSLTTVGFGDIQPANAAAKMLSVFLSTIGILYPAVVIAKLVSSVSQGHNR
jgi:hypothetical protein